MPSRRLANWESPALYGSYEELLADPLVEAVYNPLPNHLHVLWSIRALEAGKHVLCEKPIALTSAEAQTLVEAAHRHPSLNVVEAFMYPHHPQWQRALSIVKEGGIGTLRTIQSCFSYFNDDPANVRNQADIGGGALMDIGCYPISLSRLFFGHEPRRVFGWIEIDPRFQIDRLASAILDFDTGTSTFTCSTQLVPYQRVNFLGTAGRIEIEIPFNAPADRPTRIWHQTGNQPGGPIEEIRLPICNQYGRQGDAFSLSVRNGRPAPPQDRGRRREYAGDRGGLREPGSRAICGSRHRLRHIGFVNEFLVRAGFWLPKRKATA